VLTGSSTDFIDCSLLTRLDAPVLLESSFCTGTTVLVENARSSREEWTSLGRRERKNQEKHVLVWVGKSHVFSSVSLPHFSSGKS